MIRVFENLGKQIDSVKALMKQQNIAQELVEGDDLPLDWPPKGEIMFDDVSLRYRPKTELVLHDITFRIAPGEKVGICGRTGSGKSTIAQTLSRIMELEKGSIKIDGLEIGKLHLKQLRSKITVIP